MKCIVVPINKEAQRRLLFHEAIEGDVIRVFLSDKSFENIWNEDFFFLINDELNVIIDLYEHEKIKGKKNLRKLISIIEKYTSINNPIIPTLRNLTQAAIDFNTSIHFYF